MHVDGTRNINTMRREVHYGIQSQYTTSQLKQIELILKVAVSMSWVARCGGKLFHTVEPGCVNSRSLRFSKAARSLRRPAWLRGCRRRETGNVAQTAACVSSYTAWINRQSLYVTRCLYRQPVQLTKSWCVMRSRGSSALRSLPAAFRTPRSRERSSAKFVSLTAVGRPERNYSSSSGKVKVIISLLRARLSWPHI